MELQFARTTSPDMREIENIYRCHKHNALFPVHWLFSILEQHNKNAVPFMWLRVRCPVLSISHYVNIWKHMAEGKLKAIFSLFTMFLTPSLFLLT